MFYCDPCAIKKNWPISMFQSYGKCELCDKVDECNDVPSSYLPEEDPGDDKDE